MKISTGIVRKEIGLVFGEEEETIGEVYVAPYGSCAAVTSHETGESKLIEIDVNGNLDDKDIKKIWKAAFGK